MSFGSASLRRSSGDSPTHVSPLSGWVLPYLAGYGFPVGFRLPAFASWVVLLPLEDSAVLAVGLLPYRPPSDSIGVSTFHTNEMRPGWVLSLLRGEVSVMHQAQGCILFMNPSVVMVLIAHTIVSVIISMARRYRSLIDSLTCVHPSGLPLAWFGLMTGRSLGFCPPHFIQGGGDRFGH